MDGADGRPRDFGADDHGADDHTAEDHTSEDHRTDDREPLDRMLAAIGVRVDEARSLVDDATSRWRGDALRISEGTRHRLRDLFHELGLVTREDWDELELRVAQLEHRLRLLEDRTDSPL